MRQLRDIRLKQGSAVGGKRVREGEKIKRDETGEIINC